MKFRNEVRIKNLIKKFGCCSFFVVIEMGDTVIINYILYFYQDNFPQKQEQIG